MVVGGLTRLAKFVRGCSNGATCFSDFCEALFLDASCLLEVFEVGRRFQRLSEILRDVVESCEIF